MRINIDQEFHCAPRLLGRRYHALLPIHSVACSDLVNSQGVLQNATTVILPTKVDELSSVVKKYDCSTPSWVDFPGSSNNYITHVSRRSPGRPPSRALSLSSRSTGQQLPTSRIMIVKPTAAYHTTRALDRDNTPCFPPA